MSSHYQKAFQTLGFTPIDYSNYEQYEEPEEGEIIEDYNGEGTDVEEGEIVEGEPNEPTEEEEDPNEQ